MIELIGKNICFFLFYCTKVIFIVSYSIYGCDFMKAVLNKNKEIVMYIIFGFLTTIISILTYYILTITFLNPNNNLQLQIANILSWIAGVTFAYFTNRKYVFHSSNDNKLLEASQFVGSRIITLILDMLIMGIGVTVLAFNDKIIKIISQIIVIILNYIFSKLFVFKKHNDNKHIKWGIILIFVGFFLLLLFQHHFIWLYHDDYGYASLSYVSNVYLNSYSGYHTSLPDIFEFLQFHYMSWGGRILCFLVECLILRHGLWLFRLIQSMVIAGIFYYIYKIITYFTKKDDYKLAILVVALYGIFEIILQRTGFFWISASASYVFPILPFLALVYHYTMKKNIPFIVASILALVSAFSQEQISALVIAYLFLYFIWDYIETKKINYKHIVVFLFALVGFAVLMLAPGNFARLTTTPDFSNLSLISKVLLNYPIILLTTFGEQTRLFTLFFFVVFSIISYKNINECNKLKVLNAISFISNATIFIFTIYFAKGYFEGLYYLKNVLIIRNILIIIYTIQLLLSLYSLCLYCRNHKMINFIWLFLAGIGSIAVMIIAPCYPHRCIIPFMFICFILFGYILQEYIEKKTVLLIPIISILFFNFANITYGYYKNNYVNKNNHETLLLASQRIKDGEKIEKIRLKKLPDMLYASDQPYTEGYEYIQFFIKCYYQLPQEIELIYE